MKISEQVCRLEDLLKLDVEQEKEEDLRTYLAKNNSGSTKNQSGTRQYGDSLSEDKDSLRQNGDKRKSSDADLKCEEAIMKEKGSECKILKT